MLFSISKPNNLKSGWLFNNERHRLCIFSEDYFAKDNKFFNIFSKNKQSVISKIYLSLFIFNKIVNS